MSSMIKHGYKNSVSVCKKFAYYIHWKAVGIFIPTLYLMFIVINDRYIYHKPWYERPAPCETPKSTVDLMVNLTFIVFDVLVKYEVNHVMCYGTLWGALRYGKILPWDNNIDLCILRSEMQKLDLLTLKRHLQSENLYIARDYRHGVITFTNGPAEVIINIFYGTPFGEVLQDCIENRFLWFFRDNPLSFPDRLMVAPFKSVPFYHGFLPVPQDDIEILKYMYRDDWWIEKRPPNCEVKTT